MAKAATFAFKRARDARLIDKGYKYAAPLVQRHKGQARGFARAS
ncbi:hypothetical protein FDUTEX481_02066 [Tolypothrix sp. PCC 7601]|nr:hypothetical protein FDUTEX481_02066 [Tolypothrix sp. PCC 7601]